VRSGVIGVKGPHGRRSAELPGRLGDPSDCDVMSAATARTAVTNPVKQDGPDRGRLLVVGTSWLGDSVMAMPAVQALEKSHPRCSITILVKKNLVTLWQMHGAVDAVLPLETGWRGLGRTVATVRRPGLLLDAPPDQGSGRERFKAAFVLSHSTRAALIPFLARVPARRGTIGQRRGWLLSEVVESSAGDVHMAREYLAVVGCGGFPIERPRLTIPDETLRTCRATIESLAHENGDARGHSPTCAQSPAASSRSPGRLVGLFPGAARGPAKRWPTGSYARLGCRLASGAGCRVLVLGTAGERQLCARVAHAAGSRGIDLAGRLNLAELAAALSLCNAVVANDSGGMHLAAAVGTPVVGLFGATDPRVTGPLGEGNRIVLANGDLARRREIGRSDHAAQQAMSTIEVDRVYREVTELL